MKRVIRIGVVLASLLAASLSGAAGARSQAAIGTDPDRIRTIELSFDGYCDGVTITWDTDSNGITGVWTSPCASCPYGDVFGGPYGKQQFYGQWQRGFTLAPQTNYGGPAAFVTSIGLKPMGIWTMYNFDGSVKNSGTWTRCGAGTRGGTEPAGAH